MIQTQALLEARSVAEQLFQHTRSGNFLKPGKTESELNQELFEVAKAHFGIQRFWHKRIVRVGSNTIHPYRINPDVDLTLQNEDIVYIDFGPVVGDMEADFGRTYVVGNNLEHLQLLDSLKQVWQQGKVFYDSHPDLTGRDLFTQIKNSAEELGYTLADWHCGHRIGQFPHAKLIGDESQHYICPENSTPLTVLTNDGEKRFWILEVHLVSGDKRFGGFVEDLLLPEISI